MEKDFNESRDFTFIAENKIRSVQTNIQAQLEKWEIESDITLFQTSYVCDQVRNHILNYKDEPQLSKTQNNCRRIFIASELFCGICSIYAHIVDYEYGKIISDMVQWEKFKKVSSKITCKKLLESRREKYFTNEALRKLELSSEDSGNKDLGEENEKIKEVTQVPSREKDTEIVQGYEMERHSTEQEQVEKEVETVEETIPELQISRTLAPPGGESLFMDDLSSNILGNITTMRDEAFSDTFHLELPISDVSRQDLLLPTNQNEDAEISIREPTIQQKTHDNIDQILQILEGIFPQETAEIQQPEVLLKHANKSQEVLQELVAGTQHNGGGDVANSSVGSEEWSLPSIESIERSKKKRSHLIIDKATIIPDYAARAVHQNRNVEIQRVQVFEGPPSLLQSISLNHLMKAPGYMSNRLRNSKLSTLYNRHLKVEKKNAEHLFLPRRAFDEGRGVDISKARLNSETVEEMGVRVAMRSGTEKTDALIEAPERSQFQEITLAGAPPKESLVGVPMSRIINSTIEPPEEAWMEKVNSAPIVSTPRVQQLQGKSLDPKTSPPWFLSTKGKPPNAKYRKFNYVYGKLQNYWSLFESQGMEKCVTLGEFFSFESDASAADYLTVLRIVDKMAIQRKLFLEYQNGDVFIRPFETPHVSSAQFSLKEKDLMF